jgi:hypothetical protein
MPHRVRRTSASCIPRSLPPKSSAARAQSFWMRKCLKWTPRCHPYDVLFEFIRAQAPAMATSRQFPLVRHMRDRPPVPAAYELAHANASIAPLMISSTISRAGLISRIAPATWPISSGRCFINSAPFSSRSFMNGIVPLAHSCCISCCLPSHSVMYGVFNTRRGLPVNIRVRTVSS